MSGLSPAEKILAAADLIEKRGSDATPGLWWRPLNTRYKATVRAVLPEDEMGTWVDGVDPDTGQREHCSVVQVNTWSNGRHTRKRNGRDLEWIAVMNPALADPLVSLMRLEAARIGKYQPHTQEACVDPDWLELAESVLAADNHPSRKR